MLTRPRRALTVALAVLLVGGCGVNPRSGDGGTAPATHHGATSPTTEKKTAETTPESPSLPTRFFTVQELAATVGCEATLQGRAADFRQATCTMSGEKLVFVDFDTAEGQREWLDYATMYGGVYLVGERWALSGTKGYLETLLPTLGGKIEGGDV